MSFGDTFYNKADELVRDNNIKVFDIKSSDPATPIVTFRLPEIKNSEVAKTSNIPPVRDMRVNKDGEVVINSMWGMIYKWKLFSIFNIN